MNSVAPPVLEGILVKDRLGWSDHAYVGGHSYILTWMKDRIHDLPDGAYVRFTAEVIDPEPRKDK